MSQYLRQLRPIFSALGAPLAIIALSASLLAGCLLAKGAGTSEPTDTDTPVADTNVTDTAPASDADAEGNPDTAPSPEDTGPADDTTSRDADTRDTSGDTRTVDPEDAGDAGGADDAGGDDAGRDCEDACRVGARRCVSPAWKGNLEECVRTEGPESCPEWRSKSCPDGQGCSTGANSCVAHGCTTKGEVLRCSGTDREVVCRPEHGILKAQTRACPADESCLNGGCAAASCSDGIQNGSESDKDCGGSDCPKCSQGESCNGDSDCSSGYCKAGKCAAPSCTDQIKNGRETGVDCGGNCALGCEKSESCRDNSDCKSGLTCSAGTCRCRVRCKLGEAHCTGTNRQYQLCVEHPTAKGCQKWETTSCGTNFPHAVPVGCAHPKKAVYCTKSKGKCQTKLCGTKTCTYTKYRRGTCQ